MRLRYITRLLALTLDLQASPLISACAFPLGTVHVLRRHHNNISIKIRSSAREILRYSEPVSPVSWLWELLKLSINTRMPLCIYHWSCVIWELYKWKAIPSIFFCASDIARQWRVHQVISYLIDSGPYISTIFLRITWPQSRNIKTQLILLILIYFKELSSPSFYTLNLFRILFQCKWAFSFFKASILFPDLRYSLPFHVPKT